MVQEQSGPIVTDQPRITDWPMWDEPLSKIPAPLDIKQARQRLARRFNSTRPPLADPEHRQ
jgi:hypothetical protein